MAAAKISLKLLIDVRSSKVLFAEAGKDFVDFMFSLLTLPVGSVIKLLSPRSMVGSISKLYQSVENMSNTYLLPTKDKNELLQPKTLSGSASLLLLKGNDESGSFAKLKYFSCNMGCSTVTTARSTLCTCDHLMSAEMKFVVPKIATVADVSDGGEGGGFVRGVVTYMVTDDLEITPLSAISSLTLINKFGVKKDSVQLEEKVVSCGMDEGLALLKASLQSVTALTDVFLGKKAHPKSPDSST